MVADKNGFEFLSIAETKAFLSQVQSSRDYAIMRLFLDTGVRLKELVDLNIDSVSYDTKMLHVGGQHKRDIPINNQLMDALIAWSNDRNDNHSSSLFVSMHGEQKRMTGWYLDKVIRKYARASHIRQNVNSLTLRNTFAMRLLSTETSVANVSAILGLKDPRALAVYIQAAACEKEHALSSDRLEVIDHRPKIVKIITKLIRKDPKRSKVILVSPKRSASANITIGREKEISEINEYLSRKNSTLLVGALGIGKTHLLKNISSTSLLYLDSPVPLKQCLLTICEKYCPNWKERLSLGSRSCSQEIIELLIKEVKDNPIIVIDNLDRLKITDVNIFLKLFECFTILGASSNTSERLKVIWWKFRKVVLEPLSTQAVNELIKELTVGLEIPNYQLFVTKIRTTANGNPLAITEMIGQVHNLPIVHDDDVREMYHDAGIRYRDWSPLVVIIWTVVTSSRFLSFGFDSPEGYILLFVGLVA